VSTAALSSLPHLGWPGSSPAPFITMAAGVYEIDRREKSSSETVTADLTETEQLQPEDFEMNHTARPPRMRRPEGFVALLLKKTRACRVDLPRNTYVQTPAGTTQKRTRPGTQGNETKGSRQKVANPWAQKTAYAALTYGSRS
jgi:hypothetical protein